MCEEHQNQFSALFDINARHFINTWDNKPSTVLNDSKTYGLFTMANSNFLLSP